MPELEFLPPWYGLARRRKRILLLQVWTTLLLVAGLGCWLTLAKRNVSIAEASLATLNSQLQQLRSDLVKLDQQLELKRELVVREQVNAKLGVPIDMTRLLSTLERIMPREMSLVELNIDLDEQIKTSSLGKTGKKVEPQLDRRLKVRVLAVAPTDLDMVNFLTGLSGVNCFEQVAPTFARDRVESDHMMREFEVTFLINLNNWTGV